MDEKKDIYPVFEEKRFVARATKNPYIGNGMAAVSLAINHSYKDDDGTWKQVDPVYEDVVVFDDDNFRFVQDNVYKGTVVEVFGRVQYKKRRNGYVNRNIVVNDRQPEHYIRLATPLERKASTAPAKSAPTTQRRASASEYDDEIPF